MNKLTLRDVLATPAVRKTHWIGSGNPPGPGPPDYTPDAERLPVTVFGGAQFLRSRCGAAARPTR